MQHILYRVNQQKSDWDSGPILKIRIIFENIFKIFIICNILCVYGECFETSVEWQSICAKKIWKSFLSNDKYMFVMQRPYTCTSHWTKMIWTPFVQISIVAQRNSTKLSPYTRKISQIMNMIKSFSNIFPFLRNKSPDPSHIFYGPHCYEEWRFLVIQ